MKKMEPAVAGFLAAEELGEVMLMRYGRLRTPESEPEWDYVPHVLFDGLGGFAHMLKVHEGYTLALPPARRMEAPPLGVRWKAMQAALAREKLSPTRKVVPWKRYDRSIVAGIPKAIGWAVLTPEESKRLAKRAATSMNSRLLWALDRAVSELLAEPHATRLWLMPVNMRGATEASLTMVNAVSAIPIAFDEGAAPEAVHAAIKEMFQAHAQWGNWDLSMLRAKFGYAAIRAALHAYYARPRHAWMGTFSNLGDLSDPKHEAKYTFIGVPPPSVSHPLTGAIMGWGGRITLTVQAHPVLDASAEDAMRWAATWKRLALEASPPAG